MLGGGKWTTLRRVDALQSGEGMLNIGHITTRELLYIHLLLHLPLRLGLLRTDVTALSHSLCLRLLLLEGSALLFIIFVLLLLNHRVLNRGHSTLRILPGELKLFRVNYRFL